MGIEPKNYLLSLADSTPLAAVTRSNPGYQYPILDYSWTTNLPIPHFEICRIWRPPTESRGLKLAQNSVPRIGRSPG